MKKTKVKKAWREFSQTGAVGAYMTYRAMLTQEDKQPD
jgi:hypothetical protein